MSDLILYILAAIGAVVVLAIVAYVLFLAFGLLLIGVECVLDRISAAAFHAGEGRGPSHENGSKHPKPPLDRIWIETRWLKSWVGWLIRRLGYSEWNNTTTPDRPDIEKLQELREEYWEGDDAE